MARHHRPVMRAVAVLGRCRRAAGRRAAGPACPDRRDRLRRPDQLVSTRRAAHGPDRVRDGAQRVWQVDGDPPDGRSASPGSACCPLVLGDLKPDYVDLIEALDGQVIRLGRGRGYLNVLDMTLARRAAERLGDGEHAKLKRELLADAVGRRHTMVSALISIQRGQPPDDREDSTLAAALRVLDERFAGTPVLSDLLEVIESAPDPVRLAAFDRGSLRALPAARRAAAGHAAGAARRRADRRDVLAPKHRRPRSRPPRRV